MSRLIIATLYEDGEDEETYIGYVDHVYWNEKKRILKLGRDDGWQDEIDQVLKLTVSMDYPQGFPPVVDLINYTYDDQAQGSSVRSVLKKVSTGRKASD